MRYLYKNLKDNRLEDLGEFRKHTWIHIEEPITAELDDLAERFKLDAGLLHDAIDEDEMPRLEIEENATYLFTRFSYDDGNHPTTAPILIVICKELLLTVSMHEFVPMRKFENEIVQFYTTQRTKLALQLLREIVLTYDQQLTRIQKQIKVTRARLRVEDISNKDFIQFVLFEDVLNEFLSALIPTNAMLRRLLLGKALKLFGEDEDLIEDLLLNNDQLIDACKANMKTIVNIREAYATIMTNNLNRVIKLLTSLTIILTVPTIIGSFYGMNVPLPLADDPTAFWLIVGATTLIIGFLLWLFNKKRWL